MVITVEIYKQIRKMRLQGTSQRQIAASLQISRNTVKKYWDGDSVPWERKNYSREASVLTENVVAFVRRCLEEDTHSPKKQHHTAKRIYDRLVDELGFTGGETTVRRLVSQLREKPQQEAFVPLSFPPGDAMQIDWGEATVYLSGVKTAVNLFCARLCYSGAPLVLAYEGRMKKAFWMPWSRYSSTSAVSPGESSSTMEKLLLRMVSALMPGNKPGMLLWRPTMDSKPFSAIPHPEMKRVLWRAWWVTAEGIPASRFPGWIPWKS